MWLRPKFSGGENRDWREGRSAVRVVASRRNKCLLKANREIFYIAVIRWVPSLGSLSILSLVTVRLFLHVSLNSYIS